MIRSVVFLFVCFFYFSTRKTDWILTEWRFCCLDMYYRKKIFFKESIRIPSSVMTFVVIDWILHVFKQGKAIVNVTLENDTQWPLYLLMSPIITNTYSGGFSNPHCTFDFKGHFVPTIVQLPNAQKPLCDKRVAAWWSTCTPSSQVKIVRNRNMIRICMGSLAIVQRDQKQR